MVSLDESFLLCDLRHWHRVRGRKRVLFPLWIVLAVQLSRLLDVAENEERRGQ